MSKSFIGIFQKGRKKYVIGVDLITKDSSLTDEVIVGYLLTLNTSDKLAVIKTKYYYLAYTIFFRHRKLQTSRFNTE